MTLNTLVDNPLMDTEKGVEEAGTFHLICNECDSKIFSDYENPDNYTTYYATHSQNDFANGSKKRVEIDK